MRSLYIIAFILAAALSISGKSFAQGTMGMVPEPVNTNELRGYADRLDLSPHQRQAVHAIHDQYKQEFRALRQGQIAEFLKEMRAMSGNAMPKREAVEKFVKSMEDIHGKVAVLDNRMFDQMQSLLTEEQLGKLPRVRMARQRARYSSSQMMMMTGNRPVDLSEIVTEMELPGETLQNIDSTLANYEARLTSSMSKLYESSTKMILNMFDAMEGMGINEETMNDPEAAEKMAEQMQQIWKDALQKSIEAGKAVTDLNHRTYKGLLPLLPDESWRALRKHYYTRAYPQMGMSSVVAGDYYDAALKLDSLTPEQRETLQASRQEVHRTIDKRLDETVALIEQTTEGMTPWDYGSETMQQMHAKLGEFQREMAELGRKSIEGITQVIGNEAAAKLAAQVGSFNEAALAAQAKMEAEAAAAVGGAEGEEVSIDEEDASFQAVGYFDQFVPQPIMVGDVNDFAKRLKLNDEQSAVLRQLHGTYMEQFKQVRDNEIAALTDAQQNMWRYDESTQTQTGPTADAVEKVHRLRTAAIEAMARLDKAFFDDIAIAVLDDDRANDINRIRMLRERTTYVGRNNMWGSWGGGSAEWQVDVSSFSFRHPALSESDRQAIESVLLGYEPQATSAMKARHDASMRLQKAQELWQVEWTALSSEKQQMKAGLRYQEIVGEAAKQANEATQQLAQLNRRTLEQIIAALPADAGSRLRLDYNRKAHPEVYNDELSMETHLTDALKLDDLSAEQRRRLNEIAAEYRPEYASFCEKMVEITADSTNPAMMTGEDPEAWKKWQEQREQLGSIRFDRDELSQRVILDVRSILSEDQIRRIGGLPEPRKREPYEMW